MPVQCSKDINDFAAPPLGATVSLSKAAGHFVQALAEKWRELQKHSNAAPYPTRRRWPSQTLGKIGEREKAASDILSSALRTNWPGRKITTP